jgi:hypothetical protein
MYCRLKQEHAALEKDKVMGGSLRRMWNRFMHLEKMKGIGAHLCLLAISQRMGRE